MRAIWKFPFKIADEIEIEMPGVAKILHVGVLRVTSTDDGEQPCLWALVKPNSKKLSRKFLIFGTGDDVPDLPIHEPLPNDLHHVGSFRTMRGQIAWHMFARPDWMRE